MSETTCHMSISLDGFVAGPDQSLEHPLGRRGIELHHWHLDEPLHDADARARDLLLRPRGAYVMGRNMFGPIRGPWPDQNWRGWWGDNPPYHTPVFVLTNHPRESITMDGGTTFHFVTDGIFSALERATDAASGLDVRLGGGVRTIQQYLRAGLIDEMHIAVAPMLLGSGEKLFSDIDMLSLGYQCVEHVASPNATHIVLEKTG